MEFRDEDEEAAFLRGDFDPRTPHEFGVWQVVGWALALFAAFCFLVFLARPVPATASGFQWQEFPPGDCVTMEEMHRLAHFSLMRAGNPVTVFFRMDMRIGGDPHTVFETRKSPRRVEVRWRGLSNCAGAWRITEGA